MGGGSKQEIEVEVRSSGISAFTGQMDKAIGGMISFRGAAFAAGAAVAALSAAIIGKAIGAAREYNGAIRELTKVTNEAAATRLGGQMQELAQTVPLATTELVDIATAAARFGIAEKDVAQFTETVSKMAFATDLSVAEAGQAFAKLTKLTGTPVEEVERLGSTINMLGQTSATSSAEIVDNMLRSSAALHSLGLNAPEIATLAAALNEVSESAERAGTRLRRVAESLQDPATLREIAMAYYETGRASDEMTAGVRAADEAVASANANLAAAELAVQNAGQTFETRFQPAVDRATQTIEAERSKLAELESQVYATDKALEGLADEHDEFGDRIAANNIKIEETRFEAAKAGRELTEEEKQNIKEWEMANRGWRLEQMKLRQEMDEVGETREEQADAVENQRKVVEKEEAKRQQIIEEGMEAEATAIEQAEARREMAEQAVEAAVARREEAMDAYVEAFRTWVREDPVGAIQDLAEAMDEGGPTADALAGALDQVSIQALRALGANDDLAKKLEEAHKEWETATSLQREFEISAASLGSELQLLENQINSLLIPIGQEFIPYLKAAVDGISEVIEWLGQLNEAFGSSKVAAGLVIAGLAGIAVAIGAVSTPVLALVALVAALALAWKTNFGNIRGITEKTFAAITALWDEHGPTLMSSIQEILDDLRAFWDEWGDEIELITELVFESIGFIIVTMLDSALTFFNVFLALVNGDWETAWEAIEGFYKRLWGRIVEFSGGILTEVWEKMDQGLANIANGIKRWMNGIYKTIVNGFRDAANDAISDFVERVNKLLPKKHHITAPQLEGRAGDLFDVPDEGGRGGRGGRGGKKKSSVVDWRDQLSQLDTTNFAERSARDQRLQRKADEVFSESQKIDLSLRIDATGDNELERMVQRNAELVVEKTSRLDAQFAENIAGRSGI